MLLQRLGKLLNACQVDSLLLWIYRPSLAAHSNLNMLVADISIGHSFFEPIFEPFFKDDYCKLRLRQNLINNLAKLGRCNSYLGNYGSFTYRDNCKDMLWHLKSMDEVVNWILEQWKD